MDNKKVLGISIAAVVILVIAIIATSYAMFTAELSGTKENKLTTGYVKMNCTEKTFSVSNTQPMTDAEGIAATDNLASCTLTSEMAGSMYVGYDVALYDVDSATPDDALSQDNVKIRAYKTVDGNTVDLANTSSTAGVLVSSLTSSAGKYDTSISSYVIDSDYVSSNKTIVYNVKAWVASTGSSNVQSSTSTGECSNSTYTTQSTCEAAGEIWGSSQTKSQAGGSFTFKLKVGATQIFNKPGTSTNNNA